MWNKWKRYHSQRAKEPEREGKAQEECIRAGLKGKGKCSQIKTQKI